jgi:hypothetical protein
LQGLDLTLRALSKQAMPWQSVLKLNFKLSKSKAGPILGLPFLQPIYRDSGIWAKVSYTVSIYQLPLISQRRLQYSEHILKRDGSVIATG